MSHESLVLQLSYLQNENAMLENKQRELNETIQSLLQSRENFISVYEVGIVFSMLTFSFISFEVKLDVASEWNDLIGNWNCLGITSFLSRIGNEYI